jgi:hypothetical protein
MSCTTFGSAEVCLITARRVVCINGVECPSTDPADVITSACVAEVSSDVQSDNQEAIEPDMGCTADGQDPCWKIEPCTRTIAETVTVRFGAWNPALAGIMTSDVVHTNSAGDTIGVARKKGKACGIYSLEIYGNLGTKGPNCGPLGQACSTYYVYPHLKGGVRSGVTLSGRGIHYFTVEGSVAEAPTCWGSAPGGPQLGPDGNFPDPAGYDVAVSGVSEGSVSAGPLVYCGALPVPSCPVLVQ